MSCTFSGQSVDTWYQNMSTACLLWWTGMPGSDSLGWNSCHKSSRYGPDYTYRTESLIVFIKKNYRILFNWLSREHSFVDVKIREENWLNIRHFLFLKSLVQFQYFSFFCRTTVEIIPSNWNRTNNKVFD